MVKKTLWLLLAPLLLAGCTSSSITTSRITNLTPPKQVRNDTGLYLVEALWSSNQQSIRKDSFTPHVQIGLEFYPMQRTPKLPNRWEAMIPVPADQHLVNYRFKFDYLYNAIPEAKPDSKLSQPYQLEIVEP